MIKPFLGSLRLRVCVHALRDHLRCTLKGSRRVALMFRCGWSRGAAHWACGMLLLFLALLVPYAALCATDVSESLGAQSGEESTAPRDAMKIKTMEISQGEGGKRLWHLVADAASMREEGGIIFVDNPFLNYFMEGEEQPLTVDSATGDVDQSKNHIRFMGNVIAKQETNTLTTDMLEYIGEQRILLSPGPSRFSGEAMWGRSDTAVWNLNDNVLTASGNVHTEMEMAAKTTPRP